MSIHETMCVCVSATGTVWGYGKAETGNRKKAACVIDHTRAIAGYLSHSSSPNCIQNNYIQRNKRERNRVCIQTDYTGGAGRAGA